MTYFSSLGFSSCHIGAAVAEAILHDIRVNSPSFKGFPQVLVSRPDTKKFLIELKFGRNSTNFHLSNEDAKKAIILMKEGRYDPAIFDVVQENLAELEYKNMHCH